MNPVPPPVFTNQSPRVAETLATAPDPLRFSLKSWRHWLLIASIVVLLAVTGAVALFGPRDPNKEFAEHLGFVIGPLLCTLVVPVVVLCVALFIKQRKARSVVFTACVALMAGFTLLYVPLTGLANLGRAKQINAARTAAAVAEAKALSASIFSEANGLNKQLLDKGAVAVNTLTTTRQLDERLDLLRSMRAANAQTLARLDTFNADIQAIFEKHQVPEAERTAFWNGYNRGSGGADSLRRIRELDRRIIDEMIRYVGILKDSFGAWSLNAEGLALFESDETLAAFNKAATNIQTLSAEQNALIASIKNSSTPNR